MQVHVGPSMEKVELSSDLKFLSKIQIEWFKVLQIDQDLVRSDFVELNQELGNEFLNETNWGILSCAMVIPREAIAKSWHSHTFTRCEQFRRRRRRSGIGQGFYLYCGNSYLMELKKSRDK
ncbi:uncharacterized protein [Lolium perenne]|uniref:uncharacterized protein n=1 Tax=Lolium perenne TaxID=4522 RepID=UPI0021F63100|nr:uncharacterized protein LOC127341049 isoform X1 [Lolium perenne]XP_051222786.1 uncharacterized protein LOC127341049 isoform X2 [Lolium perenne]XP_051222795.1 uncharacterized protein LOC127341049 isoform X3 [Lolium perenne]XP_051222797.1 uncharacterized protein LOC127341049 isoform X3 [Lolium perenne]XP_051227798.1 uncharacterized protein LOC127345362 isoform X1 [Lolium perenne]XP_051227801.1 uncharacterized protein LOC127345363 [Lolium perenne]